jgi:tight adherence protein B
MNASTPSLVLALSAALGVALCAWWVVSPDRVVRRRRSRVNDLLLEAGLVRWTPRRLALLSAGAASLGLMAMTAVSHAVVLGLAAGAITGAAPLAWVRHLQRRRQAELRALWPDAIDHLASGVRAGLSLPEAIGQLATSGPEQLRWAFTAFAADYRSSGRFSESLDLLKERLADPVGDRVVETLRLAREVGGADLGRLLRTLSGFLRDEGRVRGELESRQSWTVNAARLAVAAPWVLLVLLGTRPEAVAAYNSTAGVIVLVAGALVSLVAYRLMMRIGRLPVETRVLR